MTAGYLVVDLTTPLTHLTKLILTKGVSSTQATDAWLGAEFSLLDVVQCLRNRQDINVELNVISYSIRKEYGPQFASALLAFSLATVETFDKANLYHNNVLPYVPVRWLGPLLIMEHTCRLSPRSASTHVPHY